LFVLSLCIALVGLLVSSGASWADDAKQQMSFGVKMARRGLWNEALFRFHQASKLDPSNARILNNLAVASEATGRFDDALVYYRKALALAPADRGVKENYSRFVEFYQSFKPPEESTEGTQEAEGQPGQDESKEEGNQSPG
jgi:Flp pilus assembly protein TadD